AVDVVQLEPGLAQAIVDRPDREDVRGVLVSQQTFFFDVTLDCLVAQQAGRRIDAAEVTNDDHTMVSSRYGRVPGLRARSAQVSGPQVYASASRLVRDQEEVLVASRAFTLTNRCGRARELSATLASASASCSARVVRGVTRCPSCGTWRRACAPPGAAAADRYGRPPRRWRGDRRWPDP